MHSASILAAFFVVGTLASPVLNTRNLPKGIAEHQHSHLEYHLLRARQKLAARDDTPAEQMIAELDKLYGGQTGKGPDDSWGNQAQGGSLTEVVAPAPVAKVVLVTNVIVVGGQQTQPPAAASTTAAAAAPVNPVAPVIENKKKVAVTQPKAEIPAQPQAPASSPAPATGSINTNGLPSDYVPDLDTTSDIYKGLAKLHHDVHRQNHSLGGLEWNSTLADYAKEVAESCIYAHNLGPGGGGYGQNIAAGNGPGNISAVLSNEFYNNELPLFEAAIGGQWGMPNPDMSNFENWGHATQMLWKDTVSFGCYTATCSPPGANPVKCNGNGQSYLKNVDCDDGSHVPTPAYNTVCNYYPPGNYAGEYGSVGGPPGKMPLVEMTGNGVVGL